MLLAAAATISPIRPKNVKDDSVGVTGVGRSRQLLGERRNCGKGRREYGCNFRYHSATECAFLIFTRSAAREARADGVRVFGILALLALPGRRINGRQMTSGRRTTDGRRLCHPLLTRAGHRTHDTHEGLFVEVAPGAGGAIPCGYGGHIGDRREGGSGCVFFVHGPIFVLCGKNASRTRQQSHLDAPPANQGSQESSYQEEEACEGVPKA